MQFLIVNSYTEGIRYNFYSTRWVASWKRLANTVQKHSNKIKITFCDIFILMWYYSNTLNIFYSILFNTFCLCRFSHSSGWAFFLWACIFEEHLNDFMQKEQWYKSTPVCVAMCSFKNNGLLNTLLQIAHGYVRVECTKEICFLSAPWCATVLLQIGQFTSTFSPCNLLMCDRNLNSFFSL